MGRISFWFGCSPVDMSLALKDKASLGFLKPKHKHLNMYSIYRRFLQSQKIHPQVLKVKQIHKTYLTHHPKPSCHSRLSLNFFYSRHKKLNVTFFLYIQCFRLLMLSFPLNALWVISFPSHLLVSVDRAAY